MQDKLKEEARKRVTKQLDGLWATVGPLSRDELGAMMDGAQEAVMEWLPQELRGAEVESMAVEHFDTAGVIHEGKVTMTKIG